MSLDAGTRVAGYEVISLLGAGGMGEVYRARDVRLGREVALKVLPPAFATDADRRARFEREARALAALNHPNIAHLYGLVESGSTCAIVMELVEGDDLGARLSRGPIPSSEAFQIARQIAEALEAAHQGNIIHRDLKPANVRVRGDGTVKVLDFGLAKALAPDGASATADAMSSRTVTANVTHLGGIVGTAAYMAPEQATGRPLDARADIWAFGCVLFEMLTGRRAFAGGSVTEILAAVVRDEPKWDLLPRDATRAAPLLRRTLRKDFRNRTHHAADLRIELEELLADPAGSAPETSRRSRSPMGLALTSGLAIATFAAGVAVGLSRRETTPSPEVPFHSQVPFETPIIGPGGNTVGAISPTGAHHAYAAPEGTVQWLWIRHFATGQIVKVPGSQGAYQPLWAPDAKRLAFFAGNKLLRTDFTAQPPTEIATFGGANTGPRGATWSNEDVILFKVGLPAIRRVQASGGAVTVLMSTAGDDNTQGVAVYPEFLPDGRHFLFLKWARTGENSIYLGNLDGTAPKKLLDSGSSLAVVPGPAVLFVRENRLLYQRLDPSAFTPIGDPAPVAEDVDVVPDSSAAQFAVGGNVLLYRSGRVENRFHWADERGHRLGDIETDPIRFGANGFSLAPTDDRAAMTRVAPGNTFNDIWVLNLQTGALSPETLGPEPDGWPCWSPDGRQIGFSRGGRLVTQVVGSKREQIWPSRANRRCAWMPDGTRIVVQQTGSVAVVDLATRVVHPLQAFKDLASLEDITEDGQLAAFTSQVSGRAEVWVSRLDGTGPVRQVTSNGGRLARWSRTGRDLFYVSGTQASKTTISGADLTVSQPVPLFDTVSPSEVMTGWDVARDGRFLLSVTDRRTVLHGLLNWRSVIPRSP